MQDEIKLERILFLDIETAPITYQYKDLSKETKALWDKNGCITKVSRPKSATKSGYLC